MLVAIVSRTEALFVFGAVVAIYLRVTIHLASARLLGMGILIIRMSYKGRKVSKLQQDHLKRMRN